EVKRLRSKIDTLKSRIIDKDLSLSDFEADIRTKSKEMKDFLSKMEALETKLSSAQKDLSMKESEIDPLRAELSAFNFILVSKNSELVHMENALASKDDELKQMKDDLALKTSEIHSLESKLSSEPIKIGGEADEKKIPNSVSRSDDAIASDIPSRDLSQYFIREKSMDRAGKINTDIPDHTDDKSASISEELVIQGYASSPKVDTKIIPKVSDEIDISETRVEDPLHGNNNNILQEIPKVTPYLAQPENNISSLIELHTQMRPSLEALPLPIGGIGAIPIVASSLMSSLSAYIFLTLLIIVVIWFVILRHTWGLERKSERLRDAWAG
ncbi:2864_t:CDS:1, partial [Entrophospora sp. SA101]